MTELLKDIMGQPTQFKNSLAYHIGNQFAEIKKACKAINRVSQVFIIGIGASYSAGIAIMHAFKKNGIFCSLIDASELENMEVFPKVSLAMILSRSGKSIEIVKSLEICKRHNIPTIAITNDTQSPLAQSADIVIPTAVKFDHSVSISTYSSLILVGGLIAIFKDKEKQIEEIILQLVSACDYIEQHQLEWQENIEKTIMKQEVLPTFFLARSESYANARAGRLLWAEVAKSQSSCFTTGNFRHGPQEVLSNKCKVVIWLSKHYNLKNDLKLVSDMIRIGSEISVITTQYNTKLDAETYIVPAVPEEFQAAFNVTPVQMMSEALSRKLGVDCDSFVFCNFIVTSEAGIQ